MIRRLLLVAVTQVYLTFCISASHLSETDSAVSFRKNRYSHISSFQCNDSKLTNENIGPNFRNISSLKSPNESISTLLEREHIILSYYANTALPTNDSSDDFNNTIFMKIGPPTHPMLNSRYDVWRIANRYISRIMLGCYNNSDMDDIFLSEVTRPFAESGTSIVANRNCFQDGDYDFSTTDLLQLLYVSRQYPGSMPDNVFNAIRDKLLSINGTITTQESYLPCRFKLGPFRVDISASIQFDTENHVLQTEVSRYLSNQLLSEVYPNNDEFNNDKNGNTKWLMEYLSTFLKTYFYEYNSRPYQAFTVKTISILHSYSLDANIQLISEMILDMISSMTTVQMNQLRRFVPFRRQPQYSENTKSRAGESEYYRMIVMVGGYLMYDSDNVLAVSSVSSIATEYRLKDFILNMFFRETSLPNEYFISNHGTVEMFYTTPNVLISAGGTDTEPQNAILSFPNRFCLFKLCLLEGYIFRKIYNQIYTQRITVERGWARPTVIVPSSETSTDLLDMLHFVGSNKSITGTLNRTFRRNLCVAPNFACGLQLEYGNVIGPLLNQCSVTVGDWRFLNLSGRGNTLCPKYSYYMAVYLRPCSMQCNTHAENYGLLEISERIESMTFSMFQQTILDNNPNPFISQGIQTYKPINGNTITFEISPVNNDQSQILQVQGIDGSAAGIGTLATTRDFNPNYRDWPLAWSANGSIQSNSMKGRWTYDSSITRERYIYDVTDPLQPKRIITELPKLIKHSSNTTNSATYTKVLGQYFDDSSNVMSNDTIKSLTFTYNVFGGGIITGFRTDWRDSGLYAIHGNIKDQSTVRIIPFNLYEQIITIGISNRVYNNNVSYVNRIRIVTNQNRTFIVGTNTVNSNDEDVYNANHIIAFYGHVGDTMIYQLRVVSMV